MLSARRYACECIRPIEATKHNLHLITVTAPYPCKECDELAYQARSLKESNEDINQSLRGIFRLGQKEPS